MGNPQEEKQVFMLLLQLEVRTISKSFSNQGIIGGHLCLVLDIEVLGEETKRSVPEDHCRRRCSLLPPSRNQPVL